MEKLLGTPSALITHWALPLIHGCGVQAGVDLYVFGSAIQNPATAADVDLIVIYEDVAELTMLRDCIERAGIGWLVDITALTRREDLETGFRDAARSVLLAELIAQKQKAQTLRSEECL